MPYSIIAIITSMVLFVILFNLVVYFVDTTFLKYLYMFTISMMTVAMVIDFKMQLIPDTVQVLLFVFGIIATAVDYTNWLGHLIGFVLGGGIYLLIAGFSILVFRKEGMGMGDVKLMACLGLIFGIKALPIGFLDFFAKADIIFTITILAFFMAAIVAILLIIGCGFDYIVQYMNWLLIDSQIPTFMLITVLTSIFVMEIILR